SSTIGVIIALSPLPFINPNIIINTRGSNLPTVDTVCIIPLVLEPRQFNTANNITTPNVIGITKDSFPNNPADCCPNITAKAAIVAGKNNTDCIQPVKKPSFLQYISSRYTIIPPVLGIAAETSAAVSPAAIVIIPAKTQAIIPRPGAPPVKV